MKRDIAKPYKTMSVVFLNGVLFVVLINLAAWGINRLSRPVEKEEVFLVPAWVTEKQMILECYPGMGPLEYEKVKASFSNTPMEYSEFVQFQAPSRKISNILNVHPAGFRFSLHQEPWPPDRTAINVFFFGGSTMFGYNAPDFYTIASFFQQFARSTLPRVKIHVYNFGQPYYYSTQERIFFQKLISQGHIPDIAVFLDGLNDLRIGDQLRFTPRLKEIFEEHKKAPHPLIKLLGALPVVQLAQRSLPRLKNRTRPREALFSEEDLDNSEMKATIETYLQRYMKNKVMIESVGPAFGVRTLFAWQPVPVYHYDTRYHYFLYAHDPSPWFEKFQYGYNIMHRLWEEDKMGSNFLWLADIQKGIRKPLYVDYVHYGAVLSKLIAENLFQYMIQNHILQKQ